MYIKYIWRLPVKFELASKEFNGKLPELYIKQWYEKYNFENYLIFPYEKKFISSRTGDVKWNFLSAAVNNKEFEKKLVNDVLYLLFYYGTDFPGLIKKYVTVKQAFLPAL